MDHFKALGLLLLYVMGIVAIGGFGFAMMNYPEIVFLCFLVIFLGFMYREALNMVRGK